MQRTLRRSLAATLAALTLPTAALAQVGVPAVPADTKRATPVDNRPPIPPGVPTTEDNVHLPTEGEVKAGRDSSAQVEKVYKLITSGPYYDRVQRVGREVLRGIQSPKVIAEYKREYHLPRKDDHSKRVPYEFNFKVLDTTREINAFSLAGGPMYVTRGLLDATTSDDELAAVLAHECTHTCFHHVEQMMRKERKIQTAQIWTMLAAVIAGAAGGGAAAAAASNVALGSQFVGIAAMTNFSRDLETEADRIGVMALTNTHYSPVAMLTFMQKLEHQDDLHANPNYGIYMDHPYTNERVDAIRKQLMTLGYQVDPGTLRAVSRRFKVTATPLRKDGKDVAELRLNGNLMMTVVAPEGGLDPVERGERMAKELESLFAQNVTFNDVRMNSEKSAVLLRGIPVVKVLPADGAAGGGVTVVAEKVQSEIIRALWKEKLETRN